MQKKQKKEFTFFRLDQKQEPKQDIEKESKEKNIEIKQEEKNRQKVDKPIKEEQKDSKKQSRKPTKEKPKTKKELTEEFKENANKLKEIAFDKKNKKVSIINSIKTILDNNKFRNSPLGIDYLRGIKLELEIAEQKPLIKKLKEIAKSLQIEI